MIDKKKILFCGAFEGEVDLLLLREFPALITGVGITASIFNLQKHLYETGERPEIIFCGSCGAYDRNAFALGEIVYSNRFKYREIAEIYGIVRVPDLIKKELYTKTFTDKSSILMGSLRCGITNSTNSITIRDIEPEKSNCLIGLDFENMESFGLAYVANEFNLHFTSLFSVTNFVGKSGSDDWNKNWRGCSERLQNFIIEKFN